MADRVSQVVGHLNYPKGLLAGQVAIITGSGQGIGAEAARLFANEGAKVVVTDIDASMLSHSLITSRKVSSIFLFCILSTNCINTLAIAYLAHSCSHIPFKRKK